MKNQFTIRELTKDHALCTVITARGYQYHCTWAIERNELNEVISPTIEEVKEAWKTEKHTFDKYRGCY